MGRNVLITAWHMQIGSVINITSDGEKRTLPLLALRSNPVTSG